MGVHKTVNGAYRYRYAPFLLPTYYVTGCSPLALPLGELSPQVTERVLQPFSNDKINLCAHTTKIPVDIPVGESQNLQPKRHQELRTFRIISKPLRFIMLRAIQFNDQSGRSIVYPLRPRYARPPLPKGEARCFPGYFSPSGTRCARPPLPKGEARDTRAVHRKLYRSAAFIS